MKKIYTILGAALLAGGSLIAQQQNVPAGAESSPVTGNAPSNPEVQTPWQLLYSYDITAAGAGTGNAGIVMLPTEFWVSKWASDTISVFNLTGTMTSQFTVAGVTGIRSLTTNGTSVYAGCNTANIYEINPVSHALVSTISVPAVPNVRYCAYDPGANGFWVGTWATDFTLVDMTGAVQNTVAAGTHALTATYGLAFDGANAGGPYLWAFHQTGATNAADLIQVNIATGMQTSVIHDVTADIGAAGDLAGGATIIPTPLTLIGVLQGTANIAFAYDIAGVVGVQEPINQTEFVSVYPNPSNEWVNVRVNNENNSMMTIRMMDVTGKVVFESNTSAPNNYINMANYAAGTYTVQVITNETVHTTQIVNQ